MKMLEPDPNYRGERVRFDDLEPPAPRDQISGVEPAYAKPARPGIGDRVKGWAKETQYRLKEKTVETLRRAEEARRERREYDKARAAFAAANRVKMDRSVDTRYWIDGENYIDVDIRYPEAIEAAQKEILRVRATVKARKTPQPTSARASPAPRAQQTYPAGYPEPPRRQPSFDFVAGTGRGLVRPPAQRPPSDAPGLSFVAGGGRPPDVSARRPQERREGMGHLAGFLGGGGQSRQPLPQQRKPAARKKREKKKKR